MPKKKKHTLRQRILFCNKKKRHRVYGSSSKQFPMLFFLVVVDMNNKNLRWNFISFRSTRCQPEPGEIIEYFNFFLVVLVLDGFLLLFELHRSNTSFINKWKGVNLALVAQTRSHFYLVHDFVVFKVDASLHANAKRLVRNHGRTNEIIANLTNDKWSFLGAFQLFNAMRFWVPLVLMLQWAAVTFIDFHTESET